MPVEHDAAIGHGIQKCFAVVERRVHSYTEPKIAGALQSKAKHQPDGDHARSADPTLIRILQMHKPKRCRESNRGRPKADSVSECKLRITAKQKLFEQSYSDEEKRPGYGHVEQPGSAEQHASERIAAKCSDQRHQQRDFP